MIGAAAPSARATAGVATLKAKTDKTARTAARKRVFLVINNCAMRWILRFNRFLAAWRIAVAARSFNGKVVNGY